MRESIIDLPPLHPKQQLAFETVANEVLYGGATRGGKSHFTRISLIVWCSLIRGLQTDIFRLNWDDVIANHMTGDNSFPELLAPWEKDGLVKINQTEIKFLETNSLISLEHCGSDEVMKKHQGIPKHVRVFEEATQILERRLRWLRAWVTPGTESFRTAAAEVLRTIYPKLTDTQLYNFFPKIFYTTNPIGPSAGYFRRNFVKARPRMEIGQAPEDDGGAMRQYIPAKVEDNPSEDAEATRRRVKGIGDDAQSDALLNENWDANVGDFIRQWDEEKHRVPDLIPPAHLIKFRSFDWGGASPAAVYWWVLWDSEEHVCPTLIDGAWRDEKRWFPVGSLVAYREWYICDPGDPAKGIDMPNKEMAKQIVTLTKEVTTGITVTDSLPFQKRGGEIMADEFMKNGVPLTQGNTDRVTGWKQMKDMLTGQDGWPRLYFANSCTYAADYIPALQRHKTKMEDAEEEGEATHSCDAIRLACMTRGKPKSLPKSSVPNEMGGPKMSLSPNGILKQLKRQTSRTGRI